jgi:hypothetical protein
MKTLAIGVYLFLFMVVIEITCMLGVETFDWNDNYALYPLWLAPPILLFMIIGFWREDHQPKIK